MLCKTLLKGNVGNPSTLKTQIPTVDFTSVDIGENSKTVYINDSLFLYLDTIPLDTAETIIVIDNSDHDT
jgi:hypothetical protein